MKWLFPLIFLAACSQDEPIVVNRAPDGAIVMAFENSKCIATASIATASGEQLWLAALNDRSKCLERISTKYRGPTYSIVEHGAVGSGPECLDVYLSATGVSGNKKLCL